MTDSIFIVGLPRTGSALVHNMIGMHRDMSRLAEMHFLNPC